MSLTLQGAVLLLLIEPARELPAAIAVVAGFALAGAALAYLWHRWRTIPHALDMALGMLTLGNLGMLLGWWADAGFAPLACPHCCSCTDPLAHPGMWLGMLAFANAAMLWLGRRPAPPGRHRLAMFTGGNLGMLLGMLVGGRLATGLEPDSLATTAATSFVAMTAGMVAGMLLGTWAAEGLFLVPRWAMRALRILPDEVERRQAEPDHDDRVADVLPR